MEKKNKNLKSLDQIRKEKSRTHWASLIVEEQEKPKTIAKKITKK